MKTLGLILTGQLRTFFDEEVHASFRSFLKGLSSEYRVYAALVINQSGVQPEQFEFLKDYIYEYSIIEYPKYHKEFEKRQEMYDTLSKVESILGSTIEKERAKESDGYCHIDSFYYQVSQIQVGLKALKQYGVVFDCMMRTRFDVICKIDIVPFSNSKNILVPHSLEQEYIRNVMFKRYGFKGLDDFLEWAKTSQWDSSLRVNGIASMLGFGGRYYNNINILDKSNYIYSYNDHMIIGKEIQFDTFLHVWDLFTDFKKMETIIKTSNITFIFAPESLFLLHFLGSEISPIVYTDETWELKR